MNFIGHIIGQTITLREFRAEDISSIRAWVNDPAVTRHLSGTFIKPHTWEQSENFLRSILNGDTGGVNLVIAERESLKYLGQINLFLIDTTARKAELGIVMPEKNAGQGIGTEAIRLMLGFAFDQMNLNRVHLKVFEHNARAIRAYEKAGFRREGVLREEAYLDGRYEDVYVMGILKGEFSADV